MHGDSPGAGRAVEFYASYVVLPLLTSLDTYSCSEVFPMGILLLIFSSHARLFLEPHMAADRNCQYLGISDR